MAPHNLAIYNSQARGKEMHLFYSLHHIIMTKYFNKWNSREKPEGKLLYFYCFIIKPAWSSIRHLQDLTLISTLKNIGHLSRNQLANNWRIQSEMKLYEPGRRLRAIRLFNNQKSGLLTEQQRKDVKWKKRPEKIQTITKPNKLK